MARKAPPLPRAIKSLGDMLRIPAFHRWMGIELIEASAERAVVRLPFRDEFIGNPLVPSIHGGLIAALIDLTGGVALFVATGVPTPTIDMRTDYLLPARGTLLATADVVRRGGTIAFVDVAVKQEDGTLVATGRCTYYVKGLTPAPKPEERFPIG